MPVRLLKGIFFHLLFYVVRTCLGQKNYLAERCKSKCLKHFVNASPMWHEKWHLSKVNASCLARPGISKRIFYVNLLFLLSIWSYYLSIFLFLSKYYSKQFRPIPISSTLHWNWSTVMKMNIALLILFCRFSTNK